MQNTRLVCVHTSRALQGASLRWPGHTTPAASLLMRQRSISLRRAASPAASTLAHCAAFGRIERCARISAAGFGGLLSGFLEVFILPLSVALKCFTTMIFCDTIRPVKTPKTLKLRIKDRHARVLGQMARKVNQVFNFCNKPAAAPPCSWSAPSTPRGALSAIFLRLMHSNPGV